MSASSKVEGGRPAAKSDVRGKELPRVRARKNGRPKAERARRTGTDKRGESARIEVLRAPDDRGSGWGLKWLIHGFSTRGGGRSKVYRPGSKYGFDLNLGFVKSDDAKTVAANRKLFLEAVHGGKEKLSLVTLQQIHSTLTRRVESGDDSTRPAALKGDGLMTDVPGVLLGIQTADCLPVLLVDRKNRAVATFHAGWRGTLQRIVENGVGRMRLEFGSRPEDMLAAIGPGIGQCCYAVGEEILHDFDMQFTYASELFREVSNSDPIKQRYPLLFLTARAPGHSDLGPSLHLDLAEANRRQLLAAGLKPEAIYLSGQCTACQPERFFSHRGEQGFTGRMMSVIGILPGGSSVHPTR